MRTCKSRVVELQRLQKSEEGYRAVLNSEITLLKVDDAFAAAWKEFKTASMNFTDCTIIALMKDLRK